MWIPSENDPIYQYIEDCIGSSLTTAAKSTLRKAAKNWKGGGDAVSHFLTVYGIALSLEVGAKICRDLKGQ